jgi:hypothetical protein
MDNVNLGKELARAAVAAVVALFVGFSLKATGAGKWLAAAGGGAVGGLTALAMIA